MPKVSIVIPTYNHAREIGRCLESIFKQTFQNFEIVVVNDGSTDNTLGVLEKYKDRIKIINQENKGASVARNRGAKEVRGEHLLFCDADLILKPKMLEKMVKVLDDNQEVSYVYSSFHFGWKVFRLWSFDEERLKKMPYIHTSSLMRKRDFPGFDEKLKKFQDWDLWLTMLENGKKGALIPEVLFKVRPRKIGISQWLPKIFYKIPWKKFGLRIRALEEYEKAKAVIKEKHHL